jgi:S-DNA-T family DNA segregation ATPase FtsK/SpoIIIE
MPPIPCSVVDDTGTPRDLQVNWTGAATAGQLAEALGAPGPLYYRGRQVDPPTPLNEIRLQEGDELGLARTTSPPVDLGAQPTLRVVAGRGAGALYPLPAGSVVLGRGANADIPLPDGDVSRRHCLLERSAGGIVVTDLSSRNGTFVDGNRLDAPATL